MDHSGILLMMAQLAVALAGFASLGLVTVSGFINLINVLGWGGSHAASLYISTLVLGLGSAGLLFLSVAASVFRGPDA